MKLIAAQVESLKQNQQNEPAGFCNFGSFLLNTHPAFKLPLLSVQEFCSFAALPPRIAQVARTRSRAEPSVEIQLLAVGSSELLKINHRPQAN